MILAACGGRGNGEKDAEGLSRAESGEGEWEVGGAEGGREGGVMGRGGYQRGGGGGGDREGESGRGQWGGELEEGNAEGSNRDGKRLAMGRGTR